MKRFAILFLLASLLTTASACGNTSAVQTDDSAALQESSDTEAVTEVSDGLPSLDFGGAELNIITHDPAGTKTNTPNLDVESQNGEVLNDAVYQQNRTIEERFHMVIHETYGPNVNDVAAAVKKTVMAGDNTYDIATIVDREALAAYADGLLYSYSELPYLNLDGEYWDKGTMEHMSVSGVVPFAYGAMNLTAYDYTALLAYNKSIADKFGIPDMYPLVNEGKWTWDKMESYIKQVSQDVNGNGLYEDGDIFGMSGRSDKSIAPMWISAGVRSVNKNNDDIPSFTVAADEKFQTVFLRVYDWFVDKKYWTPSGNDVTDEQADIFLADGSLFFCTNFKSIASYLRDMKSDFGILPYPKPDESQSGYIARVECGFPSVVTITSEHTEAAAAFLEASAFAAYRNIVPIYYETVLKNKVVRDEESKAMLDLIFASRTVDLGDTYWFAAVRSRFTKMVDNQDNTIASTAASIQDSVNSTINGVVNSILNRKNGGQSK